MGRDRRTLSAEGASQMPFDNNGVELAAQLGYRVLDALPGQQRTGQRQPPIQSVLRLGNFLPCVLLLRVGIDLRNQRA